MQPWRFAVGQHLGRRAGTWDKHGAVRSLPAWPPTSGMGTTRPASDLAENSGGAAANAALSAGHGRAVAGPLARHRENLGRIPKLYQRRSRDRPGPCDSGRVKDVGDLSGAARAAVGASDSRTSPVASPTPIRSVGGSRAHPELSGWEAHQGRAAKSGDCPPGPPQRPNSLGGPSAIVPRPDALLLPRGRRLHRDRAFHEAAARFSRRVRALLVCGTGWNCCAVGARSLVHGTELNAIRSEVLDMRQRRRGSRPACSR